MPEHTIRIRADNDIPADVLVEHIAVALQDFKFAGKIEIGIMAHPFDGPVVFDDTPLNDQELTALDPFPLTTRVVDRIKETRRHGND